MKRRRAQDRFYSCPSCHAGLNPAESITLVGEHSGDRALVGFHPEPGNYEVYFPPGVDCPQGSLWDFFCPACHANLAVASEEHYCVIDGIYDGITHRVYFSRVAGDRATFVVGDKGQVESHGPNADKHKLDLLGHV